VSRYFMKMKITRKVALVFPCGICIAVASGYSILTIIARPSAAPIRMPMIHDSNMELELEQLATFPHLEWTTLNSNTLRRWTEPTPDNNQQQQQQQPVVSFPQMAASTEYAQSIADIWKQEELSSSWSNTTEWTSIIYYDDNVTTTTTTTGDVVSKIPLHGYMIRNSKYCSVEHEQSIVLLFPTAVGSQDMFLLLKAVQIVNADKLKHCTVVIVDLFSDPTGWLWDKVRNLHRYNTIRDDLLRHATNDDTKDDLVDATKNNLGPKNSHIEPYRPMLQGRVKAVFTYIRNQFSNCTSIAALGWCFGGHCVAELARMNSSDIVPEVRAMITFHGVFSGLQLPIPLDEGTNDDESIYQSSSRRPRRSEILICHGIQDPFVTSNDLERALYVAYSLGMFCTLYFLFTHLMPRHLHVSQLVVSILRSYDVLAAT
jgi:Dienelactone hydrolase family